MSVSIIGEIKREYENFSRREANYLDKNPNANDLAAFEVGIRFGGNRLVLYPIRRNNRGTFEHRKREAIAGFSRSSGQRMANYLRECTARYYSLGTLTYPSKEGFGYDGRTAKRDFKVFAQRLQRLHLKRFGDLSEFSLFWFAEIQEKQTHAIHFHFFYTKFVDSEWVKRSWYEIVGSNLQKHLNSCENIKKIRSGRFGMCTYAKKYAAKQSQKVVPDEVKGFGRFWGIIGNRGVEAATVRIDDEIRVDAEKWQKICAISAEIAKFEAKKQCDKWIPLCLNQETGNKDMDIGVRVYNMRNPILIERVRRLINEIVDDESKITNNRGWICLSNVDTYLTERKNGGSLSVTLQE